VTASVMLPSGGAILESGVAPTKAAGVTAATKSGGQTTLQIGSGHYSILVGR